MWRVMVVSGASSIVQQVAVLYGGAFIFVCNRQCCLLHCTGLLLFCNGKIFKVLFSLTLGIRQKVVGEKEQVDVAGAELGLEKEPQ